MKDEPVLLDPLDPATDAARFEVLVSRIVHDARAARSTRPAAAEPLLIVARWTRPLLAAAATIALLASGALLSHPPATDPAASPLEGLGIPASVAAWAEADRTPDLGELLAGLAEVHTPATATPEDRQ